MKAHDLTRIIATHVGGNNNGDSTLHKDGNHGILLVLRGSRTIFVHTPNVDDFNNPCTLDIDGRPAAQLPERQMNEVYREHNFVKFEAKPGDLSVTQRCW
jgi:hypothetical protein